MTEEHQMTRREYREQHGQGFKQPLETEKEHQQQNLDDEPFIQAASHDEKALRKTREESLAEQKKILIEEKTNRLRKKLNRIIIGLLIVIILVYLGLFFVG
ncbi:hypothetical protein [uncultured Limosilactobacillus sp.]|uniref:hypothetical protein n=1 Tax=uncultured Limosilactobacillus sp. TaxID=2837629 RepID=UPI0025F7E524|nr:hypothetical protein [uncultured Limosilactobacillus sp.]